MSEQDHLVGKLVSPFASRDPDARAPGELPAADAIGEQGVFGSYGPNDSGYINNIVRDCAKDLVRASSLWCVGYGYKCERMPDAHPIARALVALCEADKETAQYANKAHDQLLFKPYRPSDEDIAAFERQRHQPAHDLTPGPQGEVGCSCNPEGL